MARVWYSILSSLKPSYFGLWPSLAFKDYRLLQLQNRGHQLWTRGRLSPQEIWAHMKIIIRHLYLGTQFLGAQISQGPNFLGTKFVRDQISWGPKKTGTQMRSGTISVIAPKSKIYTSLREVNYHNILHKYQAKLIMIIDAETKKNIHKVLCSYLSVSTFFKLATQILTLLLLVAVIIFKKPVLIK